MFTSSTCACTAMRPLFDSVAADDDEVRVKCLGDANCRCTRRLEVDRQTEMIEGVLAIVAGDRQKSDGGEALVQRVRKRIPDPGEVGLAATVVEGKDEYDAAAGIGGFGR